jgi:hypothetical protein
MEGTEEENRILSEYVLPIIKNKLETNIQVFGSGVLPQISSTSCDSAFQMPSKYKNNTTDADLILIVEFINENSSYLAYAVPCYLDLETHRPIVGLISINSKNFKLNGSTLMTNYYTLLHEIFHILAITPVLFQYYQTQPVYTESNRSGGKYKVILIKRSFCQKL